MMDNNNNSSRKRTFSEALDSEVKPNDKEGFQQVTKKRIDILEYQKRKEKEEEFRKSQKMNDIKNDLKESKKATEKQVAASRIPCKYDCHKVFISQEFMEKHVKEYHCKFCYKWYDTKFGLNLHEMYFHCKLCKKHIAINSALKLHMKESHPNENCLLCELHPKKLYFADKDDYEKHMKLDHGEKSIKCDLCHETFSSKSEDNYKKHIDEHEKFNRELEGIGDNSGMYSDHTSGSLNSEHFIVQNRNLAHFCKFCQKDVLKNEDCREHMQYFHQVSPQNHPEVQQVFLEVNDQDINEEEYENPLELTPEEEEIQEASEEIEVQIVEDFSNQNQPLSTAKNDNKEEILDEKVKKGQRNYSDAEIFEDFSNEKEPLSSKDVLGKFCDVCDKIFQTNDLLLEHKISSHKTFECHFCRKKFKTLEGKKSHILQKHESAQELEKEFSHECHLCTKKFKTLEGKNTHLAHLHGLAQEKGEELKCNLCYKVLNGKNALEQHSKWHKNKNNIPQKDEESTTDFANRTCEICERSLSNAKRKRKHMKDVHKM